ncbi:O-antigen ligase family protein [Phyllobacterium lublinensis]|uniref:O-antigen ligase family protein n=1 Tax=Phyllobacterium lublinensis TaxID=2875708 RepID=UPI001CCC2FF2|nr:O-antigen ligase family protein [Phyllobacterium sp. 2063]MBZ9657257.1 O-antigen ligase family protein [Phyllobacterium sp. 2063]
MTASPDQTADVRVDHGTRNRALIRLISTFAIGFGVFLSGFVIDEPAPYELYMAGLIFIWALFGLRLSRTVAILLAILVIFNIGGLLSMGQMADLKTAPIYIAVSLFLAITSVFFAAVIDSDQRMLPVIFRAYILAAVCTSLLGILGYFDAFPGADLFTRYGRAMGAFQDPNVFGPFLMLPLAWLVHGVLIGDLRALPVRLVPILILTLGIFLSFSRAAWGMAVLIIAGLALLLFIRNPNRLFRLRIMLLAGLAVVVVLLAVIVALQIPSVAELFFARAQLVQDYDDAQFGRFARHWYGMLLSIDHPLGIGPLEFGPIYGEDTHNVWLKAALDYGWLGFVSYMTLTMLTLGLGLRILFRERPWQPFLLCAYLVYVAHVAIGNVIDTDHWRHFYLLVGIIWGCVALELRYNPTPARHAGDVRSDRERGEHSRMQ